MKKTALILAVLAPFLLASTPLMALDFLVGAKAGYFVWEPFFKDMEGSGFGDVEKGEGVLYGPVLSVIFTPTISFSISGFFGTQNTHWHSSNYLQTWEGQTEISEISGTYYADMSRMDIDSALSYRVSELFKIFIGYKYQWISVEMRHTERRHGVNHSEESVIDLYLEILFPSHGPAVGIGYSQPLSPDFFIAANFSVLYLWSKLDMSDSEYQTYNAPTLSYANSAYREEPMGTYDLYQIGLNFEPTIGAQIGGTGVVATLSARIQYMRIKFKEDSETGHGDWYTDMLYGLFVSAMYTF